MSLPAWSAWKLCFQIPEEDLVAPVLLAPRDSSERHLLSIASHNQCHAKPPHRPPRPVLCNSLLLLTLDTAADLQQQMNKRGRQTQHAPVRTSGTQSIGRERASKTTSETHPDAQISLIRGSVVSSDRT